MRSQFLRSRDIAQALGITQRRARQLIEQGIIPGLKVNGCWVVELDEFVNYWIRFLDGDGLIAWLEGEKEQRYAS